MDNILNFALSDFGLAEVEGPNNNPKILAMAELLNVPYPNDEISWCGIAVGYWCKLAGYNPPKNHAGARNWLSWGRAVSDPKLGDIVVLWREDINSWKGHVGIYINHPDAKTINILGGNQGNKVCIAPYSSDRVLGYRRASNF